MCGLLEMVVLNRIIADVTGTLGAYIPWLLDQLVKAEVFLGMEKVVLLLSLRHTVAARIMIK